MARDPDRDILWGESLLFIGEGGGGRGGGQIGWYGGSDLMMMWALITIEMCMSMCGIHVTHTRRLGFPVIIYGFPDDLIFRPFIILLLSSSSPHPTLSHPTLSPPPQS